MLGRNLDKDELDKNATQDMGVSGASFSGRDSMHGSSYCDLGSLPVMDEEFFTDFDLCPSLTDLLNDPSPISLQTLEDDWPFPEPEILQFETHEVSNQMIDPNTQDLRSNGPSPSSSQADNGSSDHTILHMESPARDALHSSAEGTNTEGSSVVRERSADEPRDEDDRRKRLKRMLRNRQSASLSRERKKMQVVEKDQQITELQSRITQISALSNQLAQENIMLRNHVHALCQQTGQPVPENILSYPPLLSPEGQPVSNPQCQPAAAPFPGQKVAIQRMPAQRPTAALSAIKPSGRAPKRRKQQAVAGGTTVLAALFCFFIFWSPMFPNQGNLNSPEGILSAGLASQEALHSHGRVLEAMDMNTSKQIDRDAQWVAWPTLNGTSEILIQPTDLETEGRALQHLKEIGPVAVFSEYDTVADHFIHPAPWKSLASLADSALARDGISKSAKCEKVFSVDVPAVDDAKLAKKQLRQYMTQANSFKGRYQALALPPIGEKLPALEAEDSGSNKLQGRKIGCTDEAEDDYIISVMMPTKDQLDGYTALSKLYVVVLNPNKRYATYACGLERPILI